MHLSIYLGRNGLVCQTDNSLYNIETDTIQACFRSLNAMSTERIGFHPFIAAGSHLSELVKIVGSLVV